MCHISSVISSSLSDSIRFDPHLVFDLFGSATVDSSKICCRSRSASHVCDSADRHGSAMTTGCQVQMVFHGSCHDPSRSKRTQHIVQLYNWVRWNVYNYPLNNAHKDRLPKCSCHPVLIKAMPEKPPANPSMLWLKELPPNPLTLFMVPFTRGVRLVHHGIVLTPNSLSLLTSRARDQPSRLNSIVQKNSARRSMKKNTQAHSLIGCHNGETIHMFSCQVNPQGTKYNTRKPCNYIDSICWLVWACCKNLPSRLLATDHQGPLGLLAR